VLDMQATIAVQDPATRGGAVVLDDGVELTFAPAVVDPRLRALRPGQRVRILLDGDVGARVVAWLTLATFDLTGAPS
jgi:hypothetical protein